MVLFLFNVAIILSLSFSLFLKVLTPSHTIHQVSDQLQSLNKENLSLPGITKYAFPSDSELDALGADSGSGDGIVALPMSDSQEFLLTPSSTYGFSSLDELTTPDELCAAQASLSFVQVSVQEKSRNFCCCSIKHIFVLESQFRIYCRAFQL